MPSSVAPGRRAWQRLQGVSATKTAARGSYRCFTILLRVVCQLASHTSIAMCLDQDVIPASMWALSIDDRVFGPLLVLAASLQEGLSRPERNP